jgi:beta-N-acetylhexosaminidase
MRRRAAVGVGASCQGFLSPTLLLTLLFALLLSACSGSGARNPSVTPPGSSLGVTPPVRSPLQLLSPDAQAALMVRRMSLDEKLGQLIIIQFTHVTYTPGQAALVGPFQPGGVILYGYAMGTADQVRSLLTGAQRDSRIPMFTFTDQEGGVVDRLAGYTGPHMGAPEIAATGSPRVATQQGARAARDLRSLGFNADLAPDVDVALVNGPDQWGRTFGKVPQTVTTYAGAWLQGLQGQDVVGCLKHFPGLGAATTDAHTSLPVIDRSRAQFEATELAPYRALIATGQVGMVMSTDVLIPALDPKMPAELSRPIITGILREKLHFDGVAITDALYMAGITEQWSFTRAAVLAIEAGNDMIMAPWNPAMIRGVLAGLKAALASGELSMAQLDASVQRILALKLRYHLLPSLPVQGSRWMIGTEAGG